MKYAVKKQWRAVGACEYDVFFCDTKKEIGDDIVGVPDEVWAVILPGNKKERQNLVIADCYTRKDAVMVVNALSK